jgi:hypothetical protein
VGQSAPGAQRRVRTRPDRDHRAGGLRPSRPGGRRIHGAVWCACGRSSHRQGDRRRGGLRPTRPACPRPGTTDAEARSSGRQSQQSWLHRTRHDKRRGQSDGYSDGRAPRQSSSRWLC